MLTDVRRHHIFLVSLIVPPYPINLPFNHRSSLTAFIGFVLQCLLVACEEAGSRDPDRH